jgi:hypothetical protein
MKHWSKLLFIGVLTTLGGVYNSSVFCADTLAVEDDEFNYKFDFGQTLFQTKALNKIIHYDHFLKETKPMISFNYGQAQAKFHKDIGMPNYSVNNFYELKLGYLDVTDYNYKSENCFEEDYLGFRYYDNSNSDKGKINIDGWKAFWGSSTGYGWEIANNFKVALNSSNNFNWSYFNYDSNMSVSIKDRKLKARIDRTTEHVKFGRSFEAGIDIRLFEDISIKAGYEQEQIFPKHMFWYWTASELVEHTANSILTSFTSKIRHRSKVFGPIVQFVLHNGLKYGIYELRKKDMNWPIKTEAPMYFDCFKVGASFTF